ncbi:XRE family transcriptional regulator [Pseudomonas vlassakiae]|uniref:XRE family transcriptional regulator n=1 Tax=Pseudomonas vlassakiae TaxID=485888 RepID=UPI003D28E790
MFYDKDSWPENWSSQLVLIKKMLIAVGSGERLREERERTGQNQTDFGKAAGVSRGTQKAYELETSSPDIRYLCAIQEIGVDVHYVLTGSRISADLGGLSEREVALLGFFRELPEGEQANLVRTASALAATLDR